MTLTLVLSWGNRFLSKLELATVADDDRDSRAIFLIRRNVHYFRNDVFIPTDHPTKHHVFAYRRNDQSDITEGWRYPMKDHGT